MGIISTVTPIFSKLQHNNTDRSRAGASGRPNQKIYADINQLLEEIKRQI
jgi:hypothetical protein